MGMPNLTEDELYQMLMQQAGKDEKWAEYCLLVRTCYGIASKVPETQEACENTDIERLLIDGLEKLGEAVYNILPGGADEFYHYMPLDPC